MAHKLEKFYNQFLGLDTRSNKLLQSPGSFRAGSKNFRYNFQDEIINSQGFQHKDVSAPNFVDIFEYKFRDVDTGAALTQVLGVATDGNLYRKLDSTLTFTAHGAAASVSIYYDEAADTFKCDMNGLGSVTISDSMTLAQLETALEALTGVTITISGDSSVKAYLLDCVIADTTFADNVVYYWEVVPFPNGSSVPFTTTLNYNTNSDYEGISSVNLNNCIYITDGGFPMKYDGKAVYRAGVPTPRQIKDGATVHELSGIGYSSTTDASIVQTGLAAGTYAYKVRFAYKDVYGAEYYSKLSQYATLRVATGSDATMITNVGFRYGKDFPLFACRMSSTTGTTTAGGTGADGAKVFTLDTVLDRDYNYTTITIDSGVNVHLNGYTLNRTGALTNNGSILNCVTARTGGETTYRVSSGHNVKVGQCLVMRTYISNNQLSASSSFDGYYYAKVTAITSTTVKVTSPTRAAMSAYGDECVNAAWVPSDIENTKDNNGYFAPPYGVSLEIFRSKVGEVTADTDEGPFYLIGHGDVPYNSAVYSIFYDDRPDAAINVLYDDLEPGEEIPRACKYLAAWQKQLVQAGRPVDWTMKADEYPSSNYAVSAATYKDQAKYTEALLCDFQSVYWADSLSPEGFPQDGLHEFAIDTKFADRVTAIAENKDSLFALKERSTAVLSGNLAENDIVKEVLETEAGCCSHRSVEDVNGSLVWLDKYNGFYACVAGRLPENIGFPIQDYQKINSLGLDFSQASAANFRKESLYICSVGTTTFVFDYADNGTLKRNCWYLWDRIDGQSVLATSDDKLLIWDGTRTWQMKLTLTDYDFTDHKTGIAMILNQAWNHQGLPTVDKNYIGLWINSIQGDFTLTVKQYGNFLEDVIATQSNVEFIAESSSKKAIKQFVKAALPKLSAISFGMEHSTKNKAVKIQGYEIEFEPEYSIGEPKR